MLLWQLEGALLTKHNVAAPRPASMTIEHIMPQRWAAHWPLPDGRMVSGEWSADDEAVTAMTGRRRHIVHALGNLTLVTQPANAAASNGPFGAKRAWLKQSLLALNLPIVEQAAWGEETIAARGRDLAAVANRIWPARDVFH